MNDFLEQLRQAAKNGTVKEQESMASHVTFRAGGCADYYVEPAGEEELAAVVRLCRKEDMPFYILGNGSNLLVGDFGYHGVMIHMGKSWDTCRIAGNQVTAGAGILLSRVAREALDHSLTGLEAAAGIPGTIGGAMVMNAGAYGFEMKDVVQSVRVMDREGKIQTLSCDQLELSYRHSCIPDKGYIVLEVELELHPGDPATIKHSMEDFAARRKEKQPLEYPSAGSTFKRPEGYFAGKLIQDAGLRGYQVGGAQVSEKHCGFVINRGGATAGDIMQLCRDVQDKVREQFGVSMEMEVRTLGQFECTEGKDLE